MRFKGIGGYMEDINFYINEVLRLYWGGMSARKAIYQVKSKYGLWEGIR